MAKRETLHGRRTHPNVRRASRYFIIAFLASSLLGLAWFMACLWMGTTEFFDDVPHLTIEDIFVAFLRLLAIVAIVGTYGGIIGAAFGLVQSMLFAAGRRAWHLVAGHR